MGTTAKIRQPLVIKVFKFKFKRSQHEKSNERVTHRFVIGMR